MINLITALPGSGKTLYAISFVKEWSVKDNRPVFYSGIPDLDKEKLGWTEIAAEDWFKCPSGAIVIIDECQRVFRPRTISKDVPEFVSKLETHRHLGIDLVLITQHPLLADSAIRRLTGNHRHLIRRFGFESSNIHQWDSVRDNCDKSVSRKDSNKTTWNFDKSVYPLYKSAELHTVKRALPRRMIFVFLVPIFIVLACYAVYRFTEKQKHSSAPIETFSSTGAPQTASGSPPKSDYKYKNAVDEAKEYVYESTPIIAGLQHTAPKYNEITKPTQAPFPVGCVKTQTKCTCYSQQATPLEVTNQVCEDIVKHGIFEDFDVNPEKSKADSRQSDTASSDRSKQVSTAEPVTDNPSFIAPVRSDSDSLFIPHRKTAL